MLCLSAAVLAASLPVSSSVKAETLKEKKEASESELDGYKTELESMEEAVAQTQAEIEAKKNEITETNVKLEEATIEYYEELEKIDSDSQLEYELSGMRILTRLIVMPATVQVAEYEEYLDSIDSSYDGERDASQEKLDAVEELDSRLESELAELETLQNEQAAQKTALEEQISETESEISDLEEQIREEEKKAAQSRSSKPQASGSYSYDGTAYTYSQDDLELIYAIVMQEGGGSYESALAVITCACNRAVSGKWSYLGSDPLSQLTAKGQFCYSTDSHWKKYLGGNVNSNVKQAVTDALAGKRNHTYLSFRGYSVANGVNIGGNYYFNSL